MDHQTPVFLSAEWRWLRRCIALCGIFALAWTQLYRVEYWVGDHYPILAWRYGTPEMQYASVRQLLRFIKPGMTINEVCALIGPGSEKWSSRDQQRLIEASRVGPVGLSFNLRNSGSVGIDVGFENGLVVSAEPYN